MSLTQRLKKFLSNRMILSDDDQSVKLFTTEEAETWLEIGSKPTPDLIQIRNPDGVRIPSPDGITRDFQPNVIFDAITLNADWEDFQNDSADEGDYHKCTLDANRQKERQRDRQEDIMTERQTEKRQSEKRHRQMERENKKVIMTEKQRDNRLNGIEGKRERGKEGKRERDKLGKIRK